MQEISIYLSVVRSHRIYRASSSSLQASYDGRHVDSKVCFCVRQNDNYGYKARKVMLAQRAAPKTVWQQIGQIFYIAFAWNHFNNLF